MARPRATGPAVQAWIELKVDDPEALSAFAIARDRLAGTAGLRELRRARVIELTGARFERAHVEGLLLQSIQFYNPHKERCTVRLDSGEPLPVTADDWLVLVFERGGERRVAAERWWRHETGKDVVVREGVAWIATVEPAADAARTIEALTRTRDRRHGLLCNPFAQEYRIACGTVPVPWIGVAEAGLS